MGKCFGFGFGVGVGDGVGDGVGVGVGGWYFRCGMWSRRRLGLGLF